MSERNEWARAELKRRIAESGLSISDYSRNRLIRDPTTIFRWLNGKNPIPRVVCEHLGGTWRITEQAGNDE